MFDLPPSSFAYINNINDSSPIEYTKAIKFNNVLCRDMPENTVITLDTSDKEPFTGTSYSELIQNHNIEKKVSLYVLAILHMNDGVFLPMDGFCLFESTNHFNIYDLWKASHISYFVIRNIRERIFNHVFTHKKGTQHPRWFNNFIFNCKSRAATQIILGQYYESLNRTEMAAHYYLRAQDQGSKEAEDRIKLLFEKNESK